MPELRHVPTRTFECLDIALAHHPQSECVGGVDEGGAWRWQSTAAFKDEVDALSRGLIALGLAPGTKVAVAAYRNRPEWMCVDLACAQAGLLSIPVYPTISADDYRFIFGQAEVAYGFVGGGDLYGKFEAAGADTDTYVKTFTFETAEPGRPYWRHVLAQASPALDGELRRRRGAIGPADLATVIYTSGTTGRPKGVMLSHRNVCSAVEAAGERLPVEAGETVLSFLPLCHIFERTASHVYLAVGARIALTGTDKLGGPDGDLQTVRPHFFTTVPRLLEKVYEKIYARGAALTGPKRGLFSWALAQTEAYDYQHPLTGLSAAVADRLVFSKWREALGGRVKAIVTGAAACPIHVLRVFSAAGIPVREAYGLTETSPGLTINEVNDTGALMGTVGPAVRDVELAIEASDAYGPGEGEILARGPNVMQGYYRNPEATAAVFTEYRGERYFRTGDIGEFVTGPGGRRFLRITDRKKELLKTSGGKYVAPAPIEARLKEDALVEQAMVVGDGQKFVSALVVPSEEAVARWGGASATWLRDAGVRAAYQAAVDRVNAGLSHTEQIKKFVLVSGPWDVTHADGAEGELTPTLKLKRRVVRERYATEIAEVYG